MDNALEEDEQAARWFEKTVEYKFVLRVLSPLAAASPLAGLAERDWGDLIDRNAGQFRLIEFKVNRTAIKSELEKYAPEGVSRKGLDYVSYVAGIHPTLASMDGAEAHWLVFAELVPKTRHELQLYARDYWHAGAERELTQDDQMGRVGPHALFDYMEELRVLRTRGRTSASGGLVLASVSVGCTVATSNSFMRIARQRLRPQPTEVIAQDAQAAPSQIEPEEGDEPDPPPRDRMGM
jgi:hypothetical protein